MLEIPDRRPRLPSVEFKSPTSRRHTAAPSYIDDESALRKRIRHYRDGLSLRWPNSSIYFASKAFPSTAVYQVMSEEGIGIDVAGGGELIMVLADIRRGIKGLNPVVLAII